MDNNPIDLDKHRGMAAQKATDIRRALAEVEANAKLLRDKQGLVEIELLAVPAVSWIEAAAKALGLEAAAINDVNKTAYAGQATPGLADQVFGAAQGAVIGPVKTPLGWVVAHLDKITKVAGKTLDQAKPELVKELTDQKLATIAQSLPGSGAGVVSGGVAMEGGSRSEVRSRAARPPCA